MKKDKGMDDFSRLMINDSLVPDIFLVRYAQSLSRNALLVYLWLNMTGLKDSFDENTVKKFKIIPDEETGPVFAELMAASLIIRNDKTYAFDDIKAREVSDYVESLKARGTDSGMPVLTSDEKERQILADSISSTFYQGVLPYIFYRLIDKCLYEYKFDGRVCYKLFEEGYEQSIHKDLQRMENMARSWYEKGYTDIKSLEKQLEINSRIKRLIKLVGQTLRRRVNGLDIERITHWVEDLDATEELVNLAFKANEYRSSISLKNVGDTLTKWHDHGVKTAEDALKFEEEEHKENKRKASRRKAVSGSAWRTGDEAGISGNNAETDAKDKASKEAAEAKETGKAENAIPEDDADIPDDILDMFGDSDEDD
ncbi:DnaD domain protein [Butyrivibrio sp. AE2032]|uniref:DnaD domain protein n=1 Tax=Butyrivibrio sp. AE2032 TaxID=1458463 RepID=UPI0005521EC5|nr:DnaD domain protein [Butyrivibrio sp. AE2032]